MGKSVRLLACSCEKTNGFSKGWMKLALYELIRDHWKLSVWLRRRKWRLPSVVDRKVTLKINRISKKLCGLLTQKNGMDFQRGVPQSPGSKLSVSNSKGNTSLLHPPTQVCVCVQRDFFHSVEKRRGRKCDSQLYIFNNSLWMKLGVDFAVFWWFCCALKEGKKSQQQLRAQHRWVVREFVRIKRFLFSFFCGNLTALLTTIVLIWSKSNVFLYCHWNPCDPQVEHSFWM